MPTSTRDIFKILASVTLFLVFIWFIVAAGEPLLWIAAAFLIALLLNPLVGMIQKYMPKKSRLLAILSTVIIIAAVLVFAVLVMLRPLTQEFNGLSNEFSTKFNQIDVSTTINEFFKSGKQIPASYKDTISTISGFVVNLSVSVFNFFWAAFTITVLAIFMLLNPQKTVDTAVSYIPKKHQRFVNKLNNSLSEIVPKYFGGLLVQAVIISVATFIPLVLLGIPYPFALAVSMLFFDLIPYIGATLGYIFIIGFCLLIGEPQAAAILLVYVLIYQVFENNVIVPLIQKKAVSISPLSVLIALLIGSAVFGMIGALLAIHAAAMLKITYDTLVEEGYLKTGK